MSEVKIIGPNVPNMPWQDRPADKKDKSEIPVMERIIFNTTIVLMLGRIT